MNPERAMVIVAHPDDAEFLAGGSVAHAASGRAAGVADDAQLRVVSPPTSISRTPARTACGAGDHEGWPIFVDGLR
jgi:hypothetical protein